MQFQFYFDRAIKPGLEATRPIFTALQSNANGLLLFSARRVRPL
jgi:hypothetical protein